MNDGTAQMGFQIGKSAMNAGQEYMEQNVSQRLFYGRNQSSDLSTRRPC